MRRPGFGQTCLGLAGQVKHVREFKDHFYQLFSEDSLVKQLAFGFREP